MILSNLMTRRKPLHGDRSDDPLYQPRRDSFHRQDVDGRVQGSSGFGHAIDGTGRPILRDRVMAPVAHRLQAPGTITPHARQQDTDRIATPVPVDALKKYVDGRTVEVVSWLRRVPEPI